MPLVVILLLLTPAHGQQQPRHQAPKPPRQIQAPVPPPPTDEQRLANLDSEDYATRQAAFTALLDDDSLTPVRIEDLYAQATSPEQRARLLHIARHLYVRMLAEHISLHSKQGSLGVEFRPIRTYTNNFEHRSGVLVNQVLHGFPAFGRLFPGDVVLAINGDPFPDDLIEPLVQQRFMGAIQSHGPGSVITFTVFRHGREQEVTVRMAGLEALQRLYPHPGQRWPDDEIHNLEMPLEPRPPAESATIGRPLNAADEARWQRRYQRLRELEPPQPPLTVNLSE